MSVCKETLVIFQIPHLIQFHLSLGFPDPISFHVWMISVYSSQATHPCFHSLCISFLSFNLTCRSLLSHVSFLPALLNFLLWEMESSYAFNKTSLKGCQLCSVPLSPRTISEEILSNNSLHRWNFTLPKSGSSLHFSSQLCPIQCQYVWSTEGVP